MMPHCSAQPMITAASTPRRSAASALAPRATISAAATLTSFSVNVRRRCRRHAALPCTTDRLPSRRRGTAQARRRRARRSGNRRHRGRDRLMGLAGEHRVGAGLFRGDLGLARREATGQRDSRQCFRRRRSSAAAPSSAASLSLAAITVAASTAQATTGSGASARASSSTTTAISAAPSPCPPKFSE